MRIFLILGAAFIYCLLFISLTVSSSSEQENQIPSQAMELVMSLDEPNLTYEVFSFILHSNIVALYSVKLFLRIKKNHLQSTKAMIWKI